jgi:hypothetical protein
MEPSIDVVALRTLFAKMLPSADVVDSRPVWAIDRTNWPRPGARTCPDRTWEYRPLPGWPQTGVVPAWAYQWLVAVPDVAGSWVLPLDVQRRGPTAKSATAVALEQIAAVRTAQPVYSPRPVVTLDSGYDLETLARTSVDADLLVRLIRSRVVYRPPVKRPGRGRPRLHGTPFRLSDKRTHGKPRQSAQIDHPLYGQVDIDAWSDLHVRGAPEASFSVIRVQVERLPKMKQKPYPLWLAWTGGPLPADLGAVWRWYLRRFTVEHAFRFFKQTPGWTTVRPRHPQAADRWSWLMAGACWQLWLGRRIVGDVRLPWGACAARRAGHARSSPAALHRNIGPVGYSSSCTSAARKFTRTSSRTTSQACSPLPSRPSSPTTRCLTPQISHNFLSKLSHAPAVRHVG